MRTKMTLLLFAAVLAAACTSQEPGSADQGAANGLPGGVLLLGSDVGVRSLDPATGRVLFEGTGVPALGSWSPVFSSTVSGGRTTIEGRDAATGVVESRLSFLGDLSIRVASHEKPIALRSDRFEIPWRRRRVAQCGANFLDTHSQDGIGDVRPRPHVLP